MMTDEQPTLEDFKDINLEQIIYDELVAELKKHEDKYLTDIIIHPEVYKYLTRKQYKKIKRRIFYEVIWWGAESRHTKCFYSVKKMRKFVNELHRWYNDYIEIEKTWCYREYSPRHKWYYISFEPNQFVCVEKY
jgi:hypothetical protein